MLTNQHMIDCPCGSRIQERGFDRHLKTKKHQRFHDKMVAQHAAEKAERARIAQEKADAKAAEDAAFAAECLKEPFPEFPDVLRNIIDDYAEPSEAAKAKMLRAIVYSREAHADYYRDDTCKGVGTPLGSPTLRSDATSPCADRMESVFAFAFV